MAKTFEEILDTMVRRVTNCTVMEGSFIYTALAPFAMELASLYLKLEKDENNAYADTADYEHLKLIAKDRGLTPRAATPAIGKGKFDKEIPNGSRFTIANVTFLSGEKLSEGEGFFYHKLTSEGTGAGMNVSPGPMNAITFIQGLNLSELVEITVPAEDDEAQAVFLERYYATFNKKSFGGNKADYIDKVNSYEGVGGCKVYPLWNGGGTVKVSVITSEYKKPSTTLIDSIQNDIDPLEDGMGDGYAPIGHIVSIVPVDELEASIIVGLTLSEGKTFEDIKPALTDNITEYFKTLNKEWSASEHITLRNAQVKNVILNTEGVIDIDTCLINGVESNIDLLENEILKLIDIEEV